ncbi:MAG: hypothetical protein O2899_02970, partial [Bacteroidetes bacterium]|nr:hypothetical protein [Bacteroidota bacterium]
MLEGQVAVLSSGLLSVEEVLALLDALRGSALYREDQHSYLLYPDKDLPPFLDKNRLTADQVVSSPLLQALVAAGDQRIVRKDHMGGFHFNGDFRNAAELKAALGRLGGAYAALVGDHASAVVSLFEDVFDHRKFTGRSGTFFAYEGLGSIYWHMVSKLGLAVAENVQAAVGRGEPADRIQQLKEHLREIRRGIGAEKSPGEYGAFPTDPYSHTPEKAGVKQPGMTGQVKEDVLARFMELGVHVENGAISFRLDNFDPEECLPQQASFAYFDIDGHEHSVTIPAGGFGFTICQVPVVYCKADRDEVRLEMSDGSSSVLAGHQLDAETSSHLFRRTGRVRQVVCHWRHLF